MGLRFRKSINLGGGFRVNFSKSGIGYSWGGKGFRITKTASGKSRVTASIPGTGLSYSQVVPSGKRTTKNNNSTTNDDNHNIGHINDNEYDTRDIKNADARTLVSEGLEEMLASANKSLFLWKANKIVLCISLILGCMIRPFWILSAICIVLMIYFRINAIINMEYTFEDDKAIEISEKMHPLIKMTKSQKLWWISQTSKVKNIKYTAGANNVVKRNRCKASTKAPFPFKTNSLAVTFSCGKETVLFLPDKLFIIQGSKIGVLNYSDVSTTVHCQRFIEEETVPRDSQIIDYTWQYVNKSGGPDKRFQNNRKIPVCLYGKLEIRSAIGVNTDIMFSNPNIQ